MEDQKNDCILEGCRVLDISGAWGLYCGKILAELGADVVKIEPPGGDPARNMGPFYKDIPDPEKSLFWFFHNVGKRGITLNMECADGQDIFRRLAKTADFVIESCTPGYLERLGLGYAALEKINPRLVMTSITPFGQQGPYARLVASDLVVTALGGFMFICGDPDRPPVRCSAPQTFVLGGAHGAMGSMAAHYHRELTGEGQQVDVSVLQAVIFNLERTTEAYDLMKVNMPRLGTKTWRARAAQYGPLVMQVIFPCKDGYLRAALWGAQGGLIKSCTELTKWAEKDGLAGKLKDYDWSKYDGSTIPQSERNAIDETFNAFFAAKTKQELMEAAVAKGLVIGPLNNVQDLWESPHFRERKFWVELEHPELNDVITYPGVGVRMSEAPMKMGGRAPLIGEHNGEIYRNELGYSPEQLVRLKAAGVI